MRYKAKSTYRLFKQRKPKRFTYKRRFQDNGEKSAHDDMESRWEAIRDDVRGKTQRNVAKPLPLKTLVILLIALFVLMYILEGYIN